MNTYMRFAKKTKKITVLLLTVLFLLGNLVLVSPASIFAESEENTDGTATVESPVNTENPVQPEAETPPEIPEKPDETGDVPGASEESEIPVDVQEGTDPAETPDDQSSKENPLKDLQPDNTVTTNDLKKDAAESQDRNIMPMNFIDDPETIGTVEFYAKDTLFKMSFVKLTEDSVEAIPDPGIPPGEEDEEFLGWFLSAEGNGDPYDISAPARADFGADRNLKLYARFNKVISINFYNENILIHKITFSDPQETATLTQEILDEDRNLVYEGQKVFVGWTTDPNYNHETVEVLTVPPEGRVLEDSINLHAVYKPAYIISFESNGGTAYAPIAIEQGSKLSDDPDAQASYNNTLNIAKAGWNFGGWYTDEALTSVFDTEAAINENIKLYAKWTPGTADVLIVHWQEKVGLDIDHVLQRPSDYEIRESEVVRRTTDDNLILADENIAKTYTGFEAGDFNGITEVTVSGDGSTQINIYYDRSIYQFTAWHGSLNFWGYYNGNVIHTRDYKYGASLKPSWDVISGLYPRDHWYTTRTGNTSYSEPPNMPAEDLTVYGREEGNSDYIIFYAELKGTETIPIEGKDDFSFKGPGSGLVVTIEDYVDIPGFTRTGREVGRAFVWNGVQRRYEMTLTYTRNTYVLSFQNLEGAKPPRLGSSQSLLFADVTAWMLPTRFMRTVRERPTL